MKPLHIALLIAAGAVGGALVMKVTQPSPAPAPAPVAAQAPAPAPTPAVTPAAPLPEPLPAPVPVTEKKPSAIAKKPAKSVPAAQPAKSEPVVTAQNQPPATVTPQPVQQTPVEQPPAPPRDPDPPAPQPPPPPPPQQVTVKSGTLLNVRVVDGLSSERNVPGDQFTGTLDAPLIADGFVIAERGARVEGRVVAADKGGRVKGVATLAVELTRLHTSDGQTVPLNTDAFQREAESSKKSDAAKVGAGAAIGAVIGAIAGGGKGAAIGAGVGGGAGAGDVLLTRGKAATIGSETRISFRLRESFTLTEKRR